MYLSFYNLDIEPFTISADPKFLWLGEKHKEALATLRYGVLANKGFLLLTGDVGTGKTTLINALAESLGKDVIVATVHDPGLELLDFFNFIGRAFKINKTFTHKGTFLLYFSHFLKIARERNKKVLLVVDEAQRLSGNLLEEIRLLSNIEEAHTKLINIFFVGQNEFNEILLRNENRALRQRISLIHTLEALNEAETQAYIRYRLEVAGSKREIFEDGALKEIYSFSGGYPRLINIVCDYALLTGYVKEKQTLDATIIKECADELRVSLKSYEKDNGLRKPDADVFRKKFKFLSGRPYWHKLAACAVLILLFAAAGSFLYRSEPAGSGKSVSVPDDSGRQREGDADEIGTNKAAMPAQLKRQKAVSPPPEDPILETEILPASDPPDRYSNAGDKAVQIAAQPAQAADRQTLGEKPIDPASLRFPLLIFFGYNSDKLSDAAAAKLDRFVAELDREAYSKIVIRGYTDGSGQYAYNKKLSEARANSVKRYLEGKGIAPLKPEAFGMGPDGPARTAGSHEDGQLSRRVEIELY